MFGVEASSPPPPVDKTLACECLTFNVEGFDQVECIVFEGCFVLVETDNQEATD